MKISFLPRPKSEHIGQIKLDDSQNIANESLLFLKVNNKEQKNQLLIKMLTSKLADKTEYEIIDHCIKELNIISTIVDAQGDKFVAQNSIQTTDNEHKDFLLSLFENRNKYRAQNINRTAAKYVEALRQVLEGMSLNNFTNLTNDVLIKLNLIRVESKKRWRRNYIQNVQVTKQEGLLKDTLDIQLGRQNGTLGSNHKLCLNIRDPRKELEAKLTGYPEKAKNAILRCFDEKAAKLNLAKCDLTAIPSKEILTMLSPHLNHLDLSNNRINVIQDRAYTELNGLVKLCLGGNKLKLNEKMFVGLNNLKSLDLSNNDIEEIPPSVFKKLVNLQYLYLTNNNLKIIKPEFFTGLDNLRVLSLSDNGIKIIPERVFQTLVNLHNLSLSNNPIKIIKPEFFTGLDNLRVLNLCDNGIEIIKKSVFIRLEYLQELYLDNNPIKEIEPGAFTGLTTIITILLKDKPSENIENNIFKDNPIDTLGNIFDPILRDIYHNKDLKECIKVSQLAIKIKQVKLIDIYNKSNSNDEKFKLCEAYCINLLLKNQLHDPEALKKLGNRLLVTNEIDLPSIKQGIDFFVKFSNVVNLSLNNVLCNNLDYFIEKDGIEKVNSIFKDKLLILPPQQAAIDVITEQNFIQVLRAINRNIDETIISNHIIPDIKNSVLTEKIDQSIKNNLEVLIADFPNTVNNENIRPTETQRNELISLMKFSDIQRNKLVEEIKRVYIIIKNAKVPHRFIINPSDSEKNKLLKIQRLNNYKSQQRMVMLKDAIKRLLYPDIELNILQTIVVNYLANKLQMIKVESHKKECIMQYANLMRTDNEEQKESIYQIINEYLSWDMMVDKVKVQQYQLIHEKLITTDNILKDKHTEQYYEYVLNTLPFRTYQEIKGILANTQDMPASFKRKIECVLTYCMIQGLEIDNTASLNLFIVEDKNSQANYLISLENLDYLNGQNVMSFSFSEFKFNVLTQNQYTQLQTANSNEDFISQALVNNLVQLSESEDLDNDVKKIISDFATTRQITPDELNKIINNDFIKLNLREVEVQDLNLTHFDQVQFPEYLYNIISDKYTAANVVAKQIFGLIRNIITEQNIKASSEQCKKLEEVCYQIAIAPCKDITIPVQFKENLMETFKDFELKTSEGDFFQLRQALIQGLLPIMDNQKKTNMIPNLVITKAKEISSTKNTSYITDLLVEELNKITSLITNPVTQAEVSYILGIIFTDMSSINALGYQNGRINDAFARFRILGAYFLAEAVNSSTTWSIDEKNAINEEIKNLILPMPDRDEGECSGQIVNRLFGYYCNIKLNAIYTRVKGILQAKAL